MGYTFICTFCSTIDKLKYNTIQYKVSRGLSPEIVDDLLLLEEQIPCELRQRSQFPIPLVHSIFSGTESLKFLWPNIWALVSNEMKQRV